MEQMARTTETISRNASDEQVLTHAFFSAIEALKIPNKTAAKMLGRSKSYLSKLVSSHSTITMGDKTWECAVWFLRLDRALDSICGGHEETARGWMHSHNTHLNGIPVEKIMEIGGLVDVTRYLEASRK